MKTIFKWLDMPSGVGIGLLVLNVIGMMWFDTVKHGFSSNEVAALAAILAAKTTHGIMTAKGSSDDKN